MNKNDLSTKWSKYCNTDKLVDDMMALLSKYRHTYTEHGICTLLDKYFEQKEPLIRLFMTSNNYIGDMRICLKREFDRQVSANEINAFFCDFHAKFDTAKILELKDGNGKTFIDYLRTGHTLLDIASLPNEEAQTAKAANLSKFNYENMATHESNRTYNTLDRYVRFFKGAACSILPRTFAYNDGPEVKKGTKTSRAFNAVCKHYGLDKLNPQVTQVERDGKMVNRTAYPYDKLFAQYSDLVSDLKRNMHFIISLNPLDYFTMSFGVSWVSCHNIASGGWKGGCMSYMLDTTSMITYVVEKLDAPIHEIPKLYRQMYHYSNGLFVQNRLYPQGNDGATDLYAKFRGFIVEEFTELLNVGDAWTCAVGRDYVTRYVHSVGAHYKDYNSNNSCSLFYPTERAETALSNVMTIGHAGICIKCGGEYTDPGTFKHRYSSECVAH